MAAYGKLEEFRPESEVWIQYIERLEHYFAANEITDGAKKKAILLSVCGSKTYKLMSNLLAPTKPGEKTFDELKELIQKHHDPTPSEIVQRFKFNSRFRNTGETVATFVSELRRLSEHCNFGTTLETMLRDRVVCGINNDHIQRRLLSESKLTYKKALEMAMALETAAQNAADLKKTGQNLQQAQHVNKIHSNQKHQSTGRTERHDTHTEAKDECYRCGKQHSPAVCRYKDVECYSCGKTRHLSKKCRQRQSAVIKGQTKRPYQKYTGRGRGKGQPTNYMDADEEEVYTMFRVSHSKDAYITKVQLENKPVKMEIDTGASLSVISQKTLNNILDQGAKINMEPCDRKLRTYLGEPIPVVGQCTVKVVCNSQTKNLPLVIVKGEGPSLMGRDWLSELKLDWAEIFVTKLQSGTSLEDLDRVLEKYGDAFKDGLGTVKGIKAKIYVDANATPKYFKARPVPYALRDKIEEELGRLEREGTIEAVQFSEWAAPIVPIVKEDSSIRICGDYKVTVNAVSKLDNYPIPKIEDLYATLSGGSEFTKLDLSQAYQQLELDEDSKQYVTINTHKGLYRYNRLPFGVSSAPGIFQRTMENLIQGICHVVVRVDDILVTGRTRSEHLENLGEVLRRITEAGIHLK